MNVSDRTQASLDLLKASTDRLLALLHQESLRHDDADQNGIGDAIGTITRYQRLLREGLAGNDVDLIRRSVNLLTTVNKGVADSVATAENELISEQAFQVFRAATATAANIRADQDK